jgi:hypothetical protein
MLLDLRLVRDLKLRIALRTQTRRVVESAWWQRREQPRIDRRSRGPLPSLDLRGAIRRDACGSGRRLGSGPEGCKVPRRRIYTSSNDPDGH